MLDPAGIAINDVVPIGQFLRELQLFDLHLMFDELNAVINDLIQTFLGPFTEVLFRKNQQIFDDIAAADGLVSDHAQELDHGAGLLLR